MGKRLSLGPRLNYPITISRLLKRPGDPIAKQETILQYKFTWKKKVGDPFGEEWDEEQTTIAEWDTPAEGNIYRWEVREGMVIEKDMVCVEIEEACPHSVQFQGLCGMCGKDMTEMSWASVSDDTDRARINMIHDKTTLKVSEDEASKQAEETQRRLLKHRKLTLVVDLDQTIIHACIDPTVGEWQKDPSSPNYEVVKNVKSFQLNDDIVRGVVGGVAQRCNYYIKMRPGLEEFLSTISSMYELHVYTMGTRAYALNIAKIVDPEKKLFGDRIISRDENGNMTAKSLARLFPADTKMVVIIDDRADVWPKNRPNLIKVVPYDFFPSIGDINSSFLPKREELPAMIPAPKRKPTNENETESEEKTVETPTGDASVKADEGEKAKPATTPEGRISALEELVRMGGGDDQLLRKEQAAEQEKFLEKQLNDRPLQHLQEEIDKEDNNDETKAQEETKNGNTTHVPTHHRHNLLKDDDIELMYLENHLSQVHRAFYDEYDSALVNAHGGRVAQLKPGHNKKVSVRSNTAELKIIPDIGIVMPRLKAKTLAGCVIVMSGLVPLGVDLMRSEIALQAQSFGAELHTKVSRRVTHLVASTSRTRTTKVRQAAKFPYIKIVNQQWLLNSMSKWEKEDETPYLVHISDADRKRPERRSSDDMSIYHSDNYDSSESDTGDDDLEDEQNIVPSSQGSENLDGVIPDDIEDGHSPIDDLKEFDWNQVDDELNEFLGSSEDDTDGDESDTGSISSEKSSKSGSDGHPSQNQNSNSGSETQRGQKRSHGDAADSGEDSDEESMLSKKQRVAGSRTTGLKTVKTQVGEGEEKEGTSGLPTPGVTDNEKGAGGSSDGVGGENEAEAEAEGGNEEFDDDLEKEMIAEFEREEAEAIANAGSDDGGVEGGG